MTNETIKLGNTEIPITELTTMLTSESVFWALRYAYKSPTSAGIDECEDDGCYDLYQLVCKLKKEKSND